MKKLILTLAIITLSACTTSKVVDCNPEKTRVHTYTDSTQDFNLSSKYSCYNERIELTATLKDDIADQRDLSLFSKVFATSIMQDFCQDYPNESAILRFNNINGYQEVFYNHEPSRCATGYYADRMKVLSKELDNNIAFDQCLAFSKNLDTVGTTPIPAGEKKLLDVSCYGGIASTNFYAKHPKLTGMENNEFLINRAKNLFADKETIVNNCKMLFKDNDIKQTLLKSGVTKYGVKFYSENGILVISEYINLETCN
ncbi:hypothetical protein GNP79_02550 [Aliivibrio fischeri]|uniref:Lipoprotein n=1 Tax=Aliivibrio fischeri TaxID=668 RepID=A0A6N3YZ52_ALIFS|nr:hypothetical protein [Aliivibrio fischeri]MUK45986.1 hypothetical protein [Aliivibrio fischeri]MUK79673.1 hypothetical protein [Aliivibrio fischeri]MUK83363.1 hypothetical protein [Aliivibrio fischeri]